jgi:hypothetical protein
MPSRPIFPLIILSALAAIAAAAGPARADENLLRGPFPFRKDNQISAHVLIGTGQGDTMSGTKLAFDYNYKLTNGFIPLWLDLGVNAQLGGCRGTPTTAGCSLNSGDVFETLGGVRWTFAPPIPLVPYMGAVGGLVFAFPNSAAAATGVVVRAVGGANYFVFDWLGGGVQIGYSLGTIGYDSTFVGSHTYAVLDIGGGVVFQF